MPGFIIIVAICMVGAIIWGVYAAKKRREAMGMLAATLGLEFTPGKNRQLASRYAFLDKLRQGSNRYAYNIITGNYQGHGITVFDYHYETESRGSDGKRDTHHLASDNYIYQPTTITLTD